MGAKLGIKRGISPAVSSGYDNQPLPLHVENTVTKGERRGILLLWGALLLVALGLLTLWAIDEEIPEELLIPAVGLSLNCIAVLLYTIRDANKPRYLTAAAALLYWAYFARPAFWQPGRFNIVEPLADRAHASWFALAASFLILWPGAFLKMPSPLAKDEDKKGCLSRRNATLVGTVAVVGCGFLAISRLDLITGALAHPVHTLGDLGAVAVSILLLSSLRGGKHQVASYLAYGSLLIASLVGLSTGLIASGFWSPVLPLLVYIHERRRIPWLALSLGLLVIVPLWQMKHEFRRLTHDGGDGSVLERISLFAELSTGYVTGEIAPTKRTISANERMDGLVVLSRVIRLTPSLVPPMEGKTYADIPRFLVPRFIDPDKPQRDMGQFFGHRYGFLNHRDLKTSVNLPQVVEAYMNHLDWGVFWLLITGGLYAILQALVLRAEGHLLFEPAALSLGMVVFSQEMELSAVLVGVLQKFLMLAAILWFAQRYMGLRASCSDDSTEVR